MHSFVSMVYRIILCLALMIGPADAFGGSGDLKADSACPNNPSSKPHLILVIVDDWGWADFSLHNNTYIMTPVMEDLVRDGVNLNRSYAYSWCAPSRSSLLSGRMPTRVDMNMSEALTLDPSNPNSGYGIPAGMTTIGGKMKEAGYHTIYNGKWGVGFAWPDQMPLPRGYDSFLGYLQDSTDYYTETMIPSSISAPRGCELQGFTDPYIVDLWKNEGPANELNGTKWVDYILIDETLKNIREHDPSTPLHLTHSFHSIHTPLDPPDELTRPYAHIKDYSKRNYASMVTFVDSSLGKMVDELKKKCMWENTLLVVTSDNGGPIYPGPSPKMMGAADNYPLRGGKTSEFEGGLRVNNFVSGGVVPEKVRGTTTNSYVHLSDWYATFAALAGVDPYDAKAEKEGLPAVESINQWPMISGEVDEAPRKSMHVSATALYDGNWKLVSGADVSNINAALAKNPDYMQFNFVQPGYPPYSTDLSPALAAGEILPDSLDCKDGCLFDVFADPTENNEVGDEYPEILNKMKAQLQELNEDAYDPFRGVDEVNITACTIMQTAGFYGPWISANTWIYQKPPQ